MVKLRIFYKKEFITFAFDGHAVWPYRQISGSPTTDLSGRLPTKAEVAQG
jgi:hypothetical protein